MTKDDGRRKTGDGRRASGLRSTVLGLCLALVLCASAVILSACGAANFSASTTASYRVTNKDGVTTDVQYSSNKEQVGLAADIDPDTGKVSVKVDKASTSEQAIAAASAAQALALKAFSDFVTAVIPLVEKAAAASAGVPLPIKP